MSTLDVARMNTRLPADWITKVVAGNPTVELPNGNFRLPPARMAFSFVAKPGDDKIIKGVTVKGKYGVSLLFTPGADLEALKRGRVAKLPEFFPKNPTGAGFSEVFKDQADHVAPLEGGLNKAGKTFSGFVPGCVYLSPGANLDYKPGLSELVNGVPTGCFGDPDDLHKKFYSGCWVIPTVNIYPGRATENPNAWFGLASVLKIADDNPFQGGGSNDDPAETYAGLNIESPVNPASLFG